MLATAFVLSQGDCKFPNTWFGLWFHPDYPDEALIINETAISNKGACYETIPANYKYLLYSNYEKCYRCLVIHERHKNVLQFRESDCSSSASLRENCGNIPTDNALISMFRQYPKVDPVPCPFKNSPFAFEYSSNGYQFCRNSNSVVQSCTDDTRMIFKFNACTDYNIESKVTELVCLGTWREGSNRYLVGLMSDTERKMVHDEKYYCFIYSEQRNKTHLLYHISQSADQNCNDIQSDQEGALIMKLISSNHTKCMFPSWATVHHTWYTLDHKLIYKFSSRNATLRILANNRFKSSGIESLSFMSDDNDDSGIEDESNEEAKTLEWRGGKARKIFHQSRSQKMADNETKVICHSILEADEHKAQIVAHITTGCNSGYVCIVLYRRSDSLIELQQSESSVHNYEEACGNFGFENTKFITLINNSKRPVPCPHSGRFVARRQPYAKTAAVTESKSLPLSPPPANCDSKKQFKSLLNGCDASDQLSLEYNCDFSATTSQIIDFHCFGYWTDKETSVNYLIAAPVSRRSNDVNQYCFVYSFHKNNRIVPYPEYLHSVSKSLDVSDSNVNDSRRLTISLRSFTDACHRSYQNPLPVWNISLIFDGSCSNTSKSVTLSMSRTFVYLINIIWLLMHKR